jgi:hypothetical protein
MTDDIVKMIDERVERRIKDNDELCDCEVCTEVVEEPTGKTVEEKPAEDSPVTTRKTKAKKSKKVEEKTEEPSEETQKTDTSENPSDD